MTLIYNVPTVGRKRPAHRDLDMAFHSISDRPKKTVKTKYQPGAWCGLPKVHTYSDVKLERGHSFGKVALHLLNAGNELRKIGEECKDIRSQPGRIAPRVLRVDTGMFCMLLDGLTEAHRSDSWLKALSTPLRAAIMDMAYDHDVRGIVNAYAEGRAHWYYTCLKLSGRIMSVNNLVRIYMVDDTDQIQRKQYLALQEKMSRINYRPRAMEFDDNTLTF